MPDATMSAAAIGLPRKRIEAAIEALLALLDTLDDDPDAEPSLGWREPSAYLGESVNQDAADFCGRTDDCEDDDSDAEPDVEEWSLGWTSAIRQEGVNWHGGCHGDLERDVGPVRKARPPSRTGRSVMVGAEVFR